MGRLKKEGKKKKKKKKKRKKKKNIRVLTDCSWDQSETRQQEVLWSRGRIVGCRLLYNKISFLTMSFAETFTQRAKRQYEYAVRLI